MSVGGQVRVKSFIFEGRLRGSRQKVRGTLGRYPLLSLAAARDLAREYALKLSRGVDPWAERRRLALTPSVADLWDRYVTEHQYRKARRAQQDEAQMFRDYIAPTLGRRRVTDVTLLDVQRLHRKITERGLPTRANRVIEVVRKAFNLAIAWEWRAPPNPAVGVERNAEEPRNLYMTTEQRRRFLSALDACPRRLWADALMLLALTGARQGELLQARWSEFDLDAGIWTKPSAHTKQRRMHRVPLGPGALAILRRLRSGPGGAYVFGNPDNKGRPQTHLKRAWSFVRDQAGLVGFRLHDLRHTFASLLISHGHTLAEVGAMLGHTQPGTTQRYAHLMDDPMRRAAATVDQVFAPRPIGRPDP